MGDPARVPPLRGQRSSLINEKGERGKKLAAPVGMTAFGKVKSLRSKRRTRATCDVWEDVAAGEWVTCVVVIQTVRGNG